MKAIVIKRKLELSEISDIVNFIDDSNDFKIISDVILPDEFKNFNVEKYHSEYIPKRELDYQILKTINDFGDKIIDNKAISGHLTFDKAGIWHYHKFRILHSFRYLFFELFELKYFSDNFEHVHFYTDINELKSYKTLPSNATIHVIKNKKHNKLNYKTLFNYSIFFIIRIASSLLKGNVKIKQKHIIIDHSERQTCIDINTFNEIEDNYNLSYLFNKLDDDFVVLREVFLPKFRNNRIFKLKKEFFYNRNKNYKRIFGELIILKALLNRKQRKERKNALKLLRDIYKLIDTQKLSAEEDIILKYLKSFHATSSYYIYRYFAYKYFFKKNNIASISSIDENSPIVKTLLDSAKSLNIKTIGIQHGNIHDLHPAFMFTPSDRKNKVMPDYSLIWGKYYRELLITKGNYPEDSLVIVGQIRTDIIPVLNKAGKIIPSDIKDENKKIVVFASQLDRDKDVRYKVTFAVFSSVKDNPDVLLIVKLHPTEINDFEYYRAIANDAKCNNYKIIYYYDLYLLLSRSDIVITGYSTVGSEAVYFNKPLVIVDPFKQDIQNYHKSGVAFQSTNADELKEFINKILSGELKVNHSAYMDFIDNNIFKIDGKVSERCINFIKTLK